MKKLIEQFQDTVNKLFDTIEYSEDGYTSIELLKESLSDIINNKVERTVRALQMVQHKILFAIVNNEADKTKESFDEITKDCENEY